MVKTDSNIRLRDTWVEIDIDCLISNLFEMKKIITKNTRIAAVLKANAYGHGAVRTAQVLVENGVDMLAVACLTEALELRKKLDKASILIMGYTADEYLCTAIKNKITLTIFSLEQAQLISDLAKSLGMISKVHIKIDSGFNRIGMKPAEDTKRIIACIDRLENVEVEGIFTHLALTDTHSDKKQFELFMKVIKELEYEGVHIPIKHVCDSIGMVRYPDYHLDMVRVGAFLYGVRPTGFDNPSVKTKMPLTFKTKIVQIKEIEKGEGVGYDFT
jgi:alanine racemase